MVQALLDGRKTQTRRILTPQPHERAKCHGCAIAREYLGPRWQGKYLAYMDDGQVIPCKLGMPGDRLWVKETYRMRREWDEFSPKNLPVKFAGESAEQLEWLREQYIHYETCPQPNGKLTGRIRQSIYMRKWMSRIELEITNIRVERLQAIGEADAIAEGVSGASGALGTDDIIMESMPFNMPRPIRRYWLLWNSINGKGGYPWESNPWVWVLEFRRVEP